jgi:hypothetical protein
MVSTSWIGSLWVPRASDPDGLTSMTSGSSAKASLNRSRRPRAVYTCSSSALTVFWYASKASVTFTASLPVLVL